MSGAIVFFA
ncbi:hypothetical protein ECEC1866_2126, partial [Escherichia coli EC1866]